MNRNVKIGIALATGFTVLNAACLVTSAVLWMVTPTPRSEPRLSPEQIAEFRVEIEKISPQLEKLNMAFNNEFKAKSAMAQYTDRPRMIAKYVDGMYAIDVSNCPQDFQDAYLNFIKAFESAKTFYQVHGGVNDAIGLFSDGPWGTLGNAAKLTKEEQKVKKDLNEGLARLRLAAKKYGAKGF